MRRTILFTAAALAILPAAANAATFINGSFEDASVDPAGGFITLAGGSTAINGWTVTADSVDYIGGYWQPAQGARSVDLDGNGQGGIEQTFDTVAGQTYRVSFMLAGNPDGGPTGKVVSTTATGGTSTDYTFDTTGSTRTSMNWMPYSYTFTANGTSTTLSFASMTSGPYGPALDDVTVAAVPEPATWLLMIGGFGLIGFAMRRRRLGSLAAA